MNSYFYQAPQAKGSTKLCEIKSTDGNSVGSVQRYYKSTLHSAIDFLVGKNQLIVRVKAEGSHGSMVIDAFCKNYYFKRSDYYIRFLSRDWEGITFHARQINNITINPEFLIKSNDIEIISKTAMFDWVRFYQEGKEVARWRTRIKEKFKTYIEIEENASIQDPLFYAVLGQMLYFIGQ